MSIVEKIREITVKNLKDIGFWLKLIAYVLNLVLFGLWCLPERGELGLQGRYQQCLFAYSAPAYHAVLFAMLTMYTLGEPPARYYQTLLIGSGAVLYGTAGVVALYNHRRGVSSQQTALAMAVLSVIIAFIMLVDTLASEGMFKKKKT